ncbi:MAG: GGDEF domain-containing protein [Syntrophorhabdaceae bacterium]|nr:GGDEF domain-containing protein [Syntrophorhabdales bacterium]MBP9560543.1 GGDEF domain-containing protein [Syntrophorhabdaceae bacterium]
MEKVIIVSKDEHIKKQIEKTIEKEFEYEYLDDINHIFNFFYDVIPDGVIIDIQNQDYSLFNIVNQIKSDPIFGSISFIAVMDNNQPFPETNRIFIDDYIKIKDIETDLCFRLKLSLHKSRRITEVNPLTRLPGNISIDREIQDRLLKKQEFAIAYSDIDNFKPFNDKYGFGRGDEVIKATGRLILNIVKIREPNKSFVGHIGGDDFVFIMNPGLIADASQAIIHAFDEIIPTFYDIEDREKGVIESIDRQGNKRLFSFMTLSIGITHNKHTQFSHYGEIKEIASRMKSYAKRFKGSCFKVDERRNQQK